MAAEKEIKNSTLASYAVMKSLSDSKQYKNSYEILADFIRYIIVSRSLYSFSISDMRDYLRMEFGFDNIPEQAIKTSVKQIKECERKNREYVLPQGISYETDEFKRAKEASNQKSQDITRNLFEFASSQYPESEICNAELEEAFIQYLLDDSATVNHKYSDIISKFILKNNNDKDSQDKVEEIREGSILFYGLAYNINELGSINTDLTLFLDTEVLFNIVGYNGSLYQEIAEDFLNQVNAVNLRQKRIVLRYFDEVQREIIDFFTSAEKIKREHGDLISSAAMKSILNGCKTPSDVIDKQSDFFNSLKYQYGILPDEKHSYYGVEDFDYNDEVIPEGFSKDSKSFEAVKFINHIYKLRRGKRPTDYTKCGYLLVTETRRIQEISNAMRRSSLECGCALPMSVITNILWFKAGSGFSKAEYPLNTNAIYKAKRILSGELFNSITQFYDETKRQFKDGEIGKEQLSSRIVLLRDKSLMPDDITDDNVDELLDFTQQYIDRFEEGIKLNRAKTEEQKRIIDSLEQRDQVKQKENTELRSKLIKAEQERDAQILTSNEQAELIRKQREELDYFRSVEKVREGRKNHYKAFLKLMWNIGWKLSIVIGIWFGTCWICKKYNIGFETILSLVLSAIGLIPMMIGFFKRDLWEYKLSSGAQDISNEHRYSDN